MKILLLLAVICIAACATENPEVTFQSVVVSRVDTIYRFGGNELQITLKSKGVEYVSFASTNNVFTVGDKYYVFVRK